MAVLDFDKIRIWNKTLTGAGVRPTIPGSNNHTDGSWLPTDLYDRELCINTTDGILYMRSGNNIVFLNSPYTPVIQPIESSNILTFDFQKNVYAEFRPTPRPIIEDYSMVFNNDENIINFIKIAAYTGTRIVTFPTGKIKVTSQLPNFASWNSGNDQLTLNMLTNEKIEFNFYKDRTENTYTLLISQIIL